MDGRWEIVTDFSFAWLYPLYLLVKSCAFVDRKLFSCLPGDVVLVNNPEPPSSVREWITFWNATWIGLVSTAYPRIRFQNFFGMVSNTGTSYLNSDCQLVDKWPNIGSLGTNSLRYIDFCLRFGHDSPKLLSSSCENVICSIYYLQIHIAVQTTIPLQP